MKYSGNGLFFTSRAKRVVISFGLCAVFFMASEQQAFGQWVQATGFSNSGGYDQERGFLVWGDTLFADAEAPNGTTDSLFFSTNNGLTWKGFSLNGGIPLVAVGALAAPVFIAGAEPPGDNQVNEEVLSFSGDGGQKWDYDTNGWQDPNGNGIPQCLITVGTAIYMEDNASGVFQQTTPGPDWIADDTSSIWLGGTVSTVSDLIASGKDLFLSTIGAGILRQMNLTGAWTPVNNGLPSTQNEGWLPVGGGFAVSGTSLFAIIDHSASGTSFDIFRTTTNGNSWAQMNTDSQNWNNVYGFTANGSDLFVVSDSGCSVSTDNGVTWNLRNEGFTFVGGGDNITCVQVSGKYIVIGSGASGAWYRLLSDFATASVASSATPDAALNLTLFENPASSSDVKVTYTMSDAGVAKVILMDELGRTVRMLQNGSAILGENTLTIDPLTLEAGTYFVCLTAQGASAIQKLVITR